MELDKNVVKVHVAVFFKDNSDIPVLKLATAIKELFATMFPQDPQILPVPLDAPVDAPRCIFQKEDGSANITFSFSRIDFDGSLKAGSPWRSHIELIEYLFLALCKACNIKIKRLGIVVQAIIDDELIEMLNQKTSIDDFCASDEKQLSWVTHKALSDLVKININTTLQVNYNNPEIKGTLSIDVNTHINSILPEDESEITKIVGELLSRVEEKMKNVF